MQVTVGPWWGVPRSLGRARDPIDSACRRSCNVIAHILSAASSAEALHRSLHDSTPYPEGEFRELVKNALDAFPGEDEESKSARKFIRERLTNHMTYRDRVLALAAIPDQEAVASLIPDVETWAELLKKARNSTAHAGKTPASAEELAKASGLHYALTEVTYASCRSS